MTERKPAPLGINDVGGIFTTDGRDVWCLARIEVGPRLVMRRMWQNQPETSKPGDLGREGPPADFDKFMRLLPEIAPKRAYRRKAGQDAGQTPLENASD